MAKANGWQRGRYRGSRNPNVVVIFLLMLAAVAAIFAGLTLFGEKDPEDSRPVFQPVQPPDQSREPDVSSPLLQPSEPVRGIYISGPVAGDPYMDALLELIDETELNAVVIDVKNDEGNLTYRPKSGQAVEIGACVRYISDLPGLVEKLKDHGVYTIARIAAFKDPVLAKARPELALRYQNGQAVSESGTLAWVNPYEAEVWSYLEEIALDAADAGFDEVQFDYVRFPAVSAATQVNYGPSAEGLEKTEAVAGFLEQVTTSLHEQGVLVSSDVFGTVISNRTDAALIGQDYAQLAGIVDYVCPMIYPSHYAAGAFGLDVPDQAPYETIYAALTQSRTLLSSNPEAGVRAWLQDFTATWVPGHLEYGPEELRAQIQAVYDAGYTDWLLWNGRNQYTAEGLLPEP